MNSYNNSRSQSVINTTSSNSQSVCVSENNLYHFRVCGDVKLNNIKFPENGWLFPCCCCYSPTSDPCILHYNKTLFGKIEYIGFHVCKKCFIQNKYDIPINIKNLSKNHLRLMSN